MSKLLYKINLMRFFLTHYKINFCNLESNARKTMVETNSTITSITGLDKSLVKKHF